MMTLRTAVILLWALALSLLATLAEAGAKGPSVEAIENALVRANPATLASDRDRARTVASAIESASLEAVCGGPWRGSDPPCRAVWPGTRSELAAVLIVQGTRESAFAERVGAGRCGPRECDALRLPGGEVLHQARSYWQLHRSGLVPEWGRLVGVEFHPTADAALATARVLGAGYRFCRSLEGAFAQAARGTGCQWVGAPRRVRAVRMVEARLHE